ncbi:MAG: hypothetical protein K1Y36_08935 [Blastocatellia bacterium]|nr:hypothetical protein [Blastocatellia bacterium]
MKKTSEETHERNAGFYCGEAVKTKERSAGGDDLCAGKPPVAATESGVAVGVAAGGNGGSVADGGKNVDGKPGREWPVGLYVPLVVYLVVQRLSTREAEVAVAESAVARLFCGLAEETAFQVRDHANLARAVAALGSAGMTAVNRLVVGEAVRRGRADPGVVSGDPTVQELPLGYPHEAGIVRGLAQRCVRVAARIGAGATKAVAVVTTAGQQVLRSVKEYHLFAKTKETKEVVLERLLNETETLLGHSRAVAEQVRQRGAHLFRQAVATLDRLDQVTRQLLPQIHHWRTTGHVATEKILHVGIPAARAYLRHKAGKLVEFGFKYLIGRLAGGYGFGQRVTQHHDTTMPVRLLTAYRALLGPAATPDLLVFDRGGHSAGTCHTLQAAGIPHIGIQPKSQAPWLVAAADRPAVVTQRALMEGGIGTLKSTAYGFNRPMERSLETLLRPGQQSFLALNLNLFVKDLTTPNRHTQPLTV